MDSYTLNIHPVFCADNYVALLIDLGDTSRYSDRIEAVFSHFREALVLLSYYQYRTLAGQDDPLARASLHLLKAHVDGCLRCKYDIIYRYYDHYYSPD